MNHANLPMNPTEELLGRPVKLTPEIAALFLETYRSTGNITVSAHGAGLGASTVHGYLRRGQQQRSGMWRDFLDEVTRARGDFLASLATAHHKFAIGGIRKKPRCRIVTTEQGVEITTTEIIRDPVTKEIEWIEHWQEPDARAQEWELSRLDRTNYANDAGPRELEHHGDFAEHRGQPVVEVFAAALEILAQYKITPALIGPAPSESEPIETTATPVDDKDSERVG